MNSNVRRMKRQMRDYNQTICVSNATNSRSPNDLKSRIFIGNLNTSVITKRHLHLIFVQFGQIKAISMHKGYAFIQYEDQMDAINAVLTQDGQMLAGQAIDVNLVTEPKPHQKSSKSLTVSNGSETSGDITTETENNSMENSLESDINYSNFENTINDMIVDSDSALNSNNDTKCDSDLTSGDHNSIHTSTQFQTKRVKLNHEFESNADNSNDNSLETKNCENSLQLSPGESKVRADSKATSCADSISSKHLINNSDNFSYLSDSSPLATLLSNPSLSLLLNNNQNTERSCSQESLPMALTQIQQQSYDILICGNCRTFFTSLSLFIEHKRSSKCRLRFVCRCQPK